MIDLSRSRAGLLAEIEAHDPSGLPVCRITDPTVVTGTAYVRLPGRTRADLFPVLKVVLAERYAAVPRAALNRDLLMPLKHALGNACKHGNGDDPARLVTVEVVLTRSGCFIAVSDEGHGFDVGLAVQRLEQEQTYFVNHGCGLRGLHRARSTVSWENGGRTVLLCYRPPIVESAGDLPGLRRLGHPDVDPALHRLLDPAWLRTCLASELPGYGNGRAKLESCQAYLGRGPSGDDCGIRYVLRIRGEDPELPEVRILTGRLHAYETAAAADFEAATRLHDAERFKGLRLPRAVLQVPAERRLVLYDFDPWMNLWQYLTYRDSLQGLRHSARRAGKALAALHGSPAVLRRAEPDSVTARFRGAVAGGQRALEKLPGGADLVQRFRTGVQRIQDEAPVQRPRSPAPIHGALGWDCIHYGVDGFFYFYRFESCEHSDPAIDLGGFLADLLRFTLACYDPAAYRICREDFLANYNADAMHPVNPDELPCYIALALAERVRDGGPGTAAEAHQLLAALDAAGVT